MAEHNEVDDLFGKPLKAYIQMGYNTCLDLDADAVPIPYDWDRVIKSWIYRDLIYSEKDVEVRWSSSSRPPLSFKQGGCPPFLPPLDQYFG